MEIIDNNIIPHPWAGLFNEEPLTKVAHLSSLSYTVKSLGEGKILNFSKRFNFGKFRKVLIFFC